MLYTDFKRIIKAGFISFWRNGWVSFASVLIMVLALFMIGGLLFSQVLLTATLNAVAEKVDISVYFKTGAEESAILELADSIKQLPEVSAIEYVSSEESLQQFRKRHEENALISNSLDELGNNPFGANLNIRAKNPSQYESVARFLDSGNFDIIDKVNYRKNKLVIDRLAAIISISRRAGAGVAAVLGFIAMLIVFNTIRLAIYTTREEIGVMKLVGASRRYIRAPFLIEGLLYGIVASIVTVLIFWPLTYWMGPIAERFFGGINLYVYFVSNLGQIFLILLVIGILLGVVSSTIATRRYLKV